MNLQDHSSYTHGEPDKIRDRMYIVWLESLPHTNFIDRPAVVWWYDGPEWEWDDREQSITDCGFRIVGYFSDLTTYMDRAL